MDRARPAAARCVPELGPRARSSATVLRRRAATDSGRRLGRQGLAMKGSRRWSRWWAALRGLGPGALAAPESESPPASVSDRPPSEAPHEAALDAIREVDPARPESRARALAALTN